jgi:ParB/RepB/Spo0J family partition protein
MNASQLSTLDLTTIDVDPGFNPRGSIDVDALQPLADSIAQHGVLQPIIVAPFGERFVLVAGERRFRAAGIAGLTEIPAVVRDVNGDAFNVAIVENLQREQLSPIEEARAFKRAFDDGMTLVDLAAAIGVSHDLVKERIALLELPESVQAKVDAREVTLAAAKSLRTLAAAGPVVLEKVVELLDPPEGVWVDPILPRHLEHDPASVLDIVLNELPEDADIPFLAAVQFRGRPFLEQQLEWGDVDVDALRKKAKMLPEYEYQPYGRPRADAQEFSSEDVDAATAYGCVLALSDGDGDQVVWITDPAWLADRLAQKIDQALEARAKKVDGKKAAAPANAAEAEKQQRDLARKERQKEQAKQLAARERNLRLGRELAKKLHAPKPSAAGMRAIALLLVRYAGEDLGRRGLRFVDEDSQTVTTRKDNTISKVTHLKTVADIQELVVKKIAKAETAEEIYGAVLQLIVAAGYVDVNAAPPSDRYGEVRGLGGYSSSKTLTDAVAEIAAVLPDDLRKKAKRRR